MSLAKARPFDYSRTGPAARRVLSGLVIVWELERWYWRQLFQQVQHLLER
jgi:hypothetical protein